MGNEMNAKRRVWCVATMWFALVYCLAGVGGRSEAAGQTLRPFTIAVFQSEAYLADYVARDEGFGARHGLDIKFVTPSNGAAAAQPVPAPAEDRVRPRLSAAGRLDIAA
jgi:ABC-type nitrate/sulfonate/bicarbonate transport system substrate-binding protein